MNTWCSETVDVNTLACSPRPCAPKRVKLLRRDVRQQIGRKDATLTGVGHHETESARLAHHGQQQRAEDDSEHRPNPAEGHDQANPARSRLRVSVARSPRAPRGPCEDDGGQHEAIEHVVPVAQGNQRQEEDRQCAVMKNPAAQTADCGPASPANACATRSIYSAKKGIHSRLMTCIWPSRCAK